MNQPATNIAALREKSKMPARQAGGSTVRDFFNANKQAMAAVLPRHVDPDRMLRIALTAVRNVPQLMDCTTESLMGAVMQCALLGLEPNTPLGHAYMIPFKNRKKGTTEVQVIVGYKGYLQLARQSGQIVSIAAHAVYENDEFDFAYGLDEKLHHIPARGDRGEIVAFYAFAQLKDGGHQFEVMWREQVESIMRSTQSRGQYGPWKEYFEEMGRKTGIRRLAKYLPLSIEFATALAINDNADAGHAQGLDQVLTGDWSALPPVTEEPEGGGDGTDDVGGQGETAAEPDWPQSVTDEETGEVGWQDSAGEWYDRTKHAWSDKGHPAVNQDGTFRKRRGTASTTDEPPQDGQEGGGSSLE